MSRSNKRSKALTNETLLCRNTDDTIALPSLDTTGIECNFSHKLINRKRLSRDSRLIYAQDGRALIDVFIFVLIL